MQLSGIPPKFPIPFGNGAGSSYIRPIPVPSQIGQSPGAASLTDGFPPLNFLPTSAGGIPPVGQDMNGLLNQITAWERWQQAGGPVPYDSDFSTAIGGYPKGAVITAAVFGNLWLSTVDNNTSNPDQGGANWTSFSYPTLAYLNGILSSASVPPNPNNTQITSADQIGFSVDNDQSIPIGVNTVAQLQGRSGNISQFGSVANGIITITKPGEYLIESGIAVFINSSNGSDRANLIGALTLMRNGTSSGVPFTSYPKFPAGGGQASGNWSPSNTFRLLANDQITISALATTDTGSALSAGISGYTNMTMSYLNP